MKKALGLVLIFSLSISLIYFISCSDDNSSASPGTFKSLSKSEKQTLVNTSTTMVYASVSQSIAEAFAAMGSGGETSGDGAALTWSCDENGCEGESTISGYQGGTANVSGSFSGTTDTFDLDLDIDYNTYSNIQGWTISGDLSVDGSFSNTTGNLSYKGNITIQSTQYGTYQCQIDVSYDYTTTNFSVSGTWCGEDLSFDFIY